jgi:two-component system, chemotaxis family, sensor kinase CheA
VALTGELVLARNRLTALADRRRDPDLELVAHGLARLTGQLQEQVLRARMAPVREVFDRFPRAVRDLARQLDKAVRLETAGEEIELDRAILDELADPLLHLLRNAVDHGIEPPAEREAAGKPAEGRVTVTARRDRNAVVITVRDDGRGVETDRVLAEAREAGWLDTPSEDPAEQVFRILARPGFSTARRVTDVSGRGVGIDAVVHWVRRMGGTIGLTTRSGEGTTVAVRLPLTVAILPALLVGVGDRRFAVPLGFVAETTRVAGQALHRGKPVPVLDWLPLEAVGAEGVPWKPGVILEVAGRQGALVVDRLLGQEDIVVGPLAAPAGTPPWVNGATILADGGAALILDPAVLVEGVRA